MKRLLYFAYGSNMKMERMEGRCGNVTKVGTYTLLGWRLVFNVNYGYANIVQGEPTDKVHGVLYHLDDHQIHSLDAYEGYPWSYQKTYYSAGTDIIFVYRAVNRWNIEYRKPRLEYLNLILEGARENQLTELYNNLIDYKNENYKLKKPAQKI